MQEDLNMRTKLLASLALVCLMVALTGCGDTTIITPNERVVNKEVKVRDDGTSKTKITTVRENSDGTITKTEKKTETKREGDGDTIIKLPSIEIKKN